MTKLSRIPEIGGTSRELLEAAGFLDAESLAKAGAGELAKELERANRILQIAKQTPARGEVEKWIASARELTGVMEDAAVEGPGTVNHEISPQVAAMLRQAPFAIPLPASFLVEQNLAVGDIPSALLLNRYVGDLQVKVEELVPAPKFGPPSAPTSNIRLADTSGTRMEIDNSRIKSTDTRLGGIQRPVTAAKDDDRISLIRGPRVETNQGRDPKSRRFIRGVLHSHPQSIRVGAVVTLLLMALLPVGVISAFLLLLSQEVPQHFGWVPKWMLVFPLALPVFGIVYLIWGFHGTCRICNQRIFVPKKCLKNAKAHHIRGFGYIVPVSLHILLFQWFRCTYCGTPVRLKK
jgi:hypothetical protein